MKDTATLKVMGDRIAYLRIEICKMTQKDFAKSIGVARQHSISCYERGKHTPCIAACLRMVELAARHGTDIDITWLRPDLEEGRHAQEA